MEVGNTEIVKIQEGLERNLADLEKITRKLYDINIEISRKQTVFRRTYALKLNELKTKSPYYTIQIKLADGELTKEISEIEVLEAQKMYLYNKLENIRQELMILTAMMKNESELMK